MKIRARRPSAGFTLIEVLVSLTVFAVISSLSYRGLAHALATKDRIEDERQFWSGSSLAFIRMERDFSEARVRDARDAAGKPIPAFVGRSSGAGSEIEFTRGVERVGYQWDEGTLWRLSWPSLEKKTGDRPTRTAVLANVERFSASFYDRAGKAGPVWPADANLADLPRGVAVTVTLAGRGAFTRVFFIHD